MAVNPKLAARMKATASLLKLYESAEECRQLHHKAGLPIPKEVALLTTWGEEEAKSEQMAESQKRTLLTIPPPVEPLEKGWISVETGSVLPITMTKAVLREGGQLSAAAIIARVRELGVDVTEGSVANILSKLVSDGAVERSLLGLALKDGVVAPIVAAGRVHGPRSVFQFHELAAHRREAVVMYFREYGRLSRSELIVLLEKTDWVDAPISKDLVKADIDALFADKLIRRAAVDGTRKWDWEVVRKKGGLRLANAMATR